MKKIIEKIKSYQYKILLIASTIILLVSVVQLFSSNLKIQAACYLIAIFFMNMILGVVKMNTKKSIPYVVLYFLMTLTITTTQAFKLLVQRFDLVVLAIFGGIAIGMAYERYKNMNKN